MLPSRRLTLFMSFDCCLNDVCMYPASLFIVIHSSKNNSISVLWNVFDMQDGPFSATTREII